MFAFPLLEVSEIVRTRKMSHSQRTKSLHLVKEGLL